MFFYVDMKFLSNYNQLILNKRFLVMFENFIIVTCRFMKLLQQVRGSSDYKRMVKKYSDKLRFLDEITGANASANFTTLTYIFDILYANVSLSSFFFYTIHFKIVLARR